MSNEFNALRARARAKRDRHIADARSEYEETIVKIAALEQDLMGLVSSQYKKISASIEAVIPQDTTFTTVDIMAGLEALDPKRVWRKRAVDHHISRLRRRGLVKRLKRATIHEPAVYARVELPAGTSPVADMTLLEVIRNVVTRPMRTMDVVLAVLEAGYKTSMANKRHLKNHVHRELVRGGFKRDGGKWLP